MRCVGSPSGSARYTPLQRLHPIAARGCPMIDLPPGKTSQIVKRTLFIQFPMNARLWWIAALLCSVIGVTAVQPFAVAAQGEPAPLDVARVEAATPLFTHITLNLVVRSGEVRLGIFDDGRGFDMRKVSRERLGFSIMHARAARSAPNLPSTVSRGWAHIFSFRGRTLHENIGTARAHHHRRRPSDDA